MFTANEIKNNKELILEQLTTANTITLEAVIKLLELKGIIKAEEIVEIIRQINSSGDKKYN